jgi:hypothetical protein
MELRSLYPSHSAPTATGSPRTVEWPPQISERAHNRSGFVQPAMHFTYLLREAQIFCYSLDRPDKGGQ